MDSVKSIYDDHHPSAVLKYCPFCGAQDFNWDGIKAFCCQKCGHRYYINEAAAVVAIIENGKGELLLTVRGRDPFKGMLDLPGGFVDIGETAENAVRREVGEELNLKLDDLSFFGSFPNRYIFGGIVYFTLDIAFLAKVTDFSTIRAADDVENFKFISTHEIKTEDIGLDSIREIVKQYTQQKG